MIVDSKHIHQFRSESACNMLKHGPFFSFFVSLFWRLVKLILEYQMQKIVLSILHFQNKGYFLYSIYGYGFILADVCIFETGRNPSDSYQRHFPFFTLWRLVPAISLSACFINMFPTTLSWYCIITTWMAYGTDYLNLSL